jgi:hypothetical protein
MPRKLSPLLILTALGAVGPLAGPWAGPLAAQEKGAGEKKLPRLLAAKPLPTLDQKDELARLSRERYNAVLEEVRERYGRLREVPNTGLDALFDSIRRLRAAGVLAADTGRARLEFLQAYLELVRELEKVIDNMRTAGAATVLRAEMARARYMRIDAELQLLRLRRDLSGPKGKGG